MKKALLLTTVGILTATGIYFMMNRTDESPQVTLEKEEKSMGKEFDNYKVNAAEDVVIRTEEGSVIRIEKNSFVDQFGKTVEGEVDIYFREFHNLLDVILSEIPMTYDSAGTQYHFESAGMFEIKGQKNGEDIRIRTEAHIIVDLATRNLENRFNQYYFDEKKQRWDFLNKDTSFAFVDQKLNKELSQLTSEIEELKQERPMKISQANPQKINIKLDVLDEEFPELAVYKNVLFELVEDVPEDSEFEKQEWTDIVITRGDAENTYVLEFYNGDESVAFETIPVLSEEDYQSNKNELLASYQEYEKRLEEKRIKEQEARAELYSSLRRSEEIRLAQRDSIRRGNVALAETNETEVVMRRAFRVSNFGLFNCDCPANLPEGPELVATFANEDKDTLEFNNIYLVEKDKRRMFTYFSYQFHEFQCDLSSLNMIWGVTKKGKIMMADNDQFTGMTSKTTSQLFSMKEVEKDTRTRETIFKSLNF